MDIQTLKTFIYVAKLENYSKAAEELNYAQSTVTMQLQRLEKELGFPLFERIGRKNHLTSYGKEFLSYADKICNLTEEIGSIGKDLKELKGIIKIGVLESVLFSKVLPVLPEFRKKFPNIEINVKIGQTVNLKELLKQNQLDLIYVSTDENTDPALKVCYKKREELVFVAPKTHPLTKLKNVTAKNLFDYPFIVTEPTGYCYKNLLKIVSENNLSLKHNIIVDSISAITELLPTGESLAFLPEYAIKEALDKNQLTILRSDIPRQFYYSQILCTKDKWMSPIMEQFIKKFKESYGK